MQFPLWEGMDYREDHVLSKSEIRVRIRPISYIELLHCYAEALDGFPRDAQEFIVKMNMKLVDKEDPVPKSVEIPELQLYYFIVRLHIFTKVTVRLVKKEQTERDIKVKRPEEKEEIPITISQAMGLPAGDNVKAITSRIFRISGIDPEQAEKDIDWVMVNADGVMLANATARLHHSIDHKLWKLTPIQHRFLDRRGEAGDVVAETDEDLVNFFEDVKARESGQRAEVG